MPKFSLTKNSPMTIKERLSFDSPKRILPVRNFTSEYIAGPLFDIAKDTATNEVKPAHFSPVFDMPMA
jgi:hypothetical protein